MASTATTSKTTGKAKKGKKPKATGELSPKTRISIIVHYQQFVAAVEKHLTDPGFPSFFADTGFVDKMSAYLDGVAALDRVRVTARAALGNAHAAVTQGNLVLSNGEGALIAFYGTQDPVLADFGIAPKHPKKVRRKKKAAGVAPAPGTGPSDPTPPDGSTTPAGAGSAGGETGTAVGGDAGGTVAGASATAPAGGTAPAGTPTAAPASGSTSGT